MDKPVRESIKIDILQYCVSDFQCWEETIPDRKHNVSAIMFLSLPRALLNINKLHDCVGKASSTAAYEDCVTTNSHQISSSSSNLIQAFQCFTILEN